MHSALFSACLIVVTATVSATPSGAQPMDIRPCASLPNPYERADCIRRSASPPENSASTARPAPSFDCRFARTSIERAICSDDELADWDARMGQAFQQTMRTQRDTRAVQERQRNWIVQRDRTCGANPEIPFSCLLEMTKQRFAILSNEAAAVAQQQSAPPSISSAPSQGAASDRFDSSAEAALNTIPQLSQNTTPSSSTASAPNVIPSSSNAVSREAGGVSPIVLILGVCLAAWLASKVVRDITRRRNFEQRRESLAARFGGHAADMILAHQIWQGMTEEQLIESWGNPVEVGTEIARNKSKQTWKYSQIGRNRFRERVYLENGLVVGWKN
jgi:uncharacterized protein